jgi:hypothetical protein
MVLSSIVKGTAVGVGIGLAYLAGSVRSNEVHPELSRGKINLTLFEDANENGTYDGGEDQMPPSGGPEHMSNKGVRIEYIGNPGEDVEAYAVTSWPHRVTDTYKFNSGDGIYRFPDDGDFMIQLNQALQNPGKYHIVISPVGGDYISDVTLDSAFTPLLEDEIKQQIERQLPTRREEQEESRFKEMIKYRDGEERRKRW